jgi:hypothetical protein
MSPIEVASFTLGASCAWAGNATEKIAASVMLASAAVDFLLEIMHNSLFESVPLRQGWRVRP